MEIYRLDGETDDELIWRVCNMKDGLGVTWSDIADIINELTGNDYGESTYRKKFQSFKKIFEANQKNIFKDDSYLKQIRHEQQVLKIERQKLTDERADINRRLRSEARAEETIEILKQMVNDIGRDRYQPLCVYTDTEHLNTGMVACLSDLHIGASFESSDGNVYDPDVANARIEQYIKEIIGIQSKHKCKTCYIFLCGDLISGNIHNTISITNKENVISQVKHAASLIANFIYAMSVHFEDVVIASVSGNHSRINPNKEDAILSERLDDLVVWIASQMTAHIYNVHADAYKYDDTLTCIRIYDKDYFIVHGDFDSINDAAISKLALYVGIIPDVVVCGHKHFPASTEVSGVTVIQSGSLCGSGDQFTKQKRLKGKPSQTVLIVNDKGIECMYPVILE